MKLQAFSIYDSKAESFSPPFCVPAVGQAIRTFTEFARDANHPIGKHFADYGLYRIGTYDDESGLFVSEIAPVPLVSGTEAASIGQPHGLKVERA